MTDTALTTAIKAIARNETLEGDTLETAFELLLTGEAAPEEIGAFLTGLAVRGETATELTAGARIMRQHARTVHVEGPVLDTCGTGGLPWKSLNSQRPRHRCRWWPRRQAWQSFGPAKERLC